MMAEYEARIDAELVSERPIDMFDSIWIEELTWMEVRDMMADGFNIAIISTGGIEQNGPYVATGKHNYVLQGTCEAIARELGKALCAPIMKLVPEGDIDEPSGHMRYPGTISLRQETFEAVLDDVASSLRAHGFEHIVFIGDSGGNVQGMANVAARLNERWEDAHAHHIPEYYRYGGGRIPRVRTGDRGDGERRDPRQLRDHEPDDGRRPDRRPLRAAGEGGSREDQRRPDRPPGRRRSRSAASSRPTGPPSPSRRSASRSPAPACSARLPTAVSPPRSPVRARGCCVTALHRLKPIENLILNWLKPT